MDQKNYETAREEIISRYAGTGVSYHASTEAVRSRLPLRGEFVDPIAGTDVAHLKFAKGQRLVFFSYAIGKSLPDGFGGERLASRADTNITEPNRIPGDLAIEEIQISDAGTVVRYEGLDFATPGVVDATVKAAYEGKLAVRMSDPGALAKPRQFDSPFLSQDAIMDAILPSLVISLGRKLGEQELPLATGLEVQSSDSRSALKQLGCCKSFRTPIGIRWSSDQNGPTQDTNIIVTLEEDVVIPVNTVRLFGAASGQATSVPKAAAVWLEVRARGLWLKTGKGLALGAC